LSYNLCAGVSGKSFITATFAATKLKNNRYAIAKIATDPITKGIALIYQI
jgi:hypothetical protein